MTKPILLRCAAFIQRRRPILLAFALIGYAASLHIRLITVLPDPFIEPDSLTYIAPGLNALSGEPLNFSASRGYGYPIFLLGILRVFKHFSAVLWTQHSLAVITGLLTALLFVRHVYRLPALAAFVFILVSGSPRSVFYGHETLTEGFFSFLQVLALFGIFESVSSRTKIWPWATGLIIVLAISTRPSGLALPVALLCALPILWRQVSSRRAVLGILGACLLGSFGVMAVSKADRGFWGFEKSGGKHLAGSLLPYLNLEKIEDPRLKEALQPSFMPQYRTLIKDPNWVLYAPEGPVARIVSDPDFQKDAGAILMRLNVLAFSEAPLSFLKNYIRVGINFTLWGAQLPPANVMRKEFGYLDTLRRFYQFTESRPALRSLLRFQPEKAEAIFSKLSTTPVFPFESGFTLHEPAWWLRQVYPFLPWVGFAAIPVLAFWPRGRRLALLLTPLILFQIALLSLIGVQSWRYSYPFEPLYTLLIAGALARFAEYFRTNNQVLSRPYP